MEACPRTPLANAWLRHTSQAASRYATRPAPRKGSPLGKSYTLKTIVLKLNPLVLNLALSKISLRDSTRSAILAPIEVLLLLALSKCCR